MSDRVSCPLCQRKHRGDDVHCSDRCRERAAKPADLVLGMRRLGTGYVDKPKSPKGKSGAAQGKHRGY